MTTELPAAAPLLAAAPAGRKGTFERVQLAVVFVLFVVLRAADRVFNKRVNDRMVNYQMAYVNFFWPVAVQVMTYGLCAGWVGYHRYGERDLAYGASFFLPVSAIASAHWMASSCVRARMRSSPSSRRSHTRSTIDISPVWSRVPCQ